MRSVIIGLLVVMLLAGAGVPAPRVGPLAAATPVPEALLYTREGPALQGGMVARADVWFSGDWYRGRLAGEATTVLGPDDERLTLSWATAGGLAGELTMPGREPPPLAAALAALEDGFFQRDDADGAVALPGNTVCAVKRMDDGQFLPAGTVPY